MSVNENHTNLRIDPPPEGFIQCLLTRPTDVGEDRMYSCLPPRFAKKGMWLRLRDKKGDEWTYGWQVKEVFRR